MLFDKWCVASKVTDFQALREFILLEEFKGCISDRIAVYINEQKVSSLSNASVLADEFTLTHKTVLLPEPKKFLQIPLLRRTRHVLSLLAQKVGKRGSVFIVTNPAM